MHAGQSRALALIVMASWLLLDALRAAGPLLAHLAESGMILVGSIAAVTALGAGTLSWLAAVAARHLPHAAVLMFLLAITALFRLAMPWLSGGWLVALGLYLVALSAATVVLSTRVAIGAGGGSLALAGTSLGAAAAVAEQAVLRTWDAVWRTDALGWSALFLVALLSLIAGWRARTLEPAPTSRGWWAYGLHWTLLVSVSANLGVITTMTEQRTSAGIGVALVGLLAAAALALRASRSPRWVVVLVAIMAVGAFAATTLAPGMYAVAGTVAATVTGAFLTARVLRAQPTALPRGLVASFIFAVMLITPTAVHELLALLTIDVSVAVVLAAAMVLVAIAAVTLSWTLSSGATASPPIAPEVRRRANAVSVVGVLSTVLLAVWTMAIYEASRLYSADFVQAPRVLSWNVNHGLQPGAFGGPAVDMDEIVATVRDSGADVILLQEVGRGWLPGGGVDMLEYLAGELRLPVTYTPAESAHLGSAILTSRPFDNARTVDLPAGDGAPRSAAVVEFMGAQYASTQLAPSPDADDLRQDQLRTLRRELPATGPVVIAGDLSATPGSAVLDSLTVAGFHNAQEALDVEAQTAVDTSDRYADAIIGRDVEFLEFTVVPSGVSDHLPMQTRVSGGTPPDQ